MVWNRSYLNKINTVYRFYQHTWVSRFLNLNIYKFKKKYITKSSVILKKRWKRFKVTNLINYIMLRNDRIKLISRTKTILKWSFFKDRTLVFLSSMNDDKGALRFVNKVFKNKYFWTRNMLILNFFIPSLNIKKLNIPNLNLLRDGRMISTKSEYIKNKEVINFLQLLNYYLLMQGLKELYKINILLVLKSTILLCYINH